MRRHFWSKPFCDLKVVTTLVLEQVSAINDSKGTKECRNIAYFQTRKLFSSHSAGSHSLQSHGLQHSRLSCLHYLPEFAQTHVHWLGDTIQPTHPLLSPSPPAFSLSQQEEKFYTSFIYSGFKNRGLTNLTEVQARLVHWKLQNIVKWEFSSVQLLSCVQLCDPKDCSMPGLPVHHQLPELAQTHVHLPSNHLILCCPLLLLPSIFPSIQGLFRWVSSLPQVAKVLELQLQHSSFQRIVRFDFL